MRDVLAGIDTNWLGRYEIVGSRVHSLETMTDHLVSTIPSEQDDVCRLTAAGGAVDDRLAALDTFRRDRGRISDNRAILLVVDESSPFYAPVNHLWEPLLRLEREKGRLVLRLRSEELSAGSGEISCALEVLNGNTRL